MTYRELFEAAVRMVDETTAEENIRDYEERATYLLATVCQQCASLDRFYRQAYGAEDAEVGEIDLCVELDASFALSAAFAPAVTYYLAAMLVLDENEDMSDTLFSHYANALASIRSGLPMKASETVDRYEGTV